MKQLLILAAVFCMPFFAVAQKSALSGNEEITWLGLDFTQVKYLGSATQFKDAGEISNEQMRDKFFAAWNELFVNEPKKFDVAKHTGHSSVKYATAVTEKANNASKSNYFSDNPDDYQLLSEDKVKKMVKGYNFQGNKGVGLLFFVEGMSKNKEQGSAWVTYVNMDSKTVLETKRVTGKAGGFGFRNYWAASWFNILKNIK